MPLDPTQRRRRLPDAETEQRMLDAALAMVNRSGLTVSLDHISFEEVIREAGVSRTAVYRRWPYKDLFFSDLLRRLASGAAPAAAVGAETGQRVLAEVASGQADALDTPEGRLRLVSEMLRLAAESDLRAVHQSVEWRTYLALQATFESLPNGELREEIQATLAGSERNFVERVAQGWERMSQAMGLRLKPGTGADFHTIALMASATMRGMVLIALSDESLLTQRAAGDPTAIGTAADWTPIGLAAASIALAYLEPDPTVTWNDERRAALDAVLNTPPSGIGAVATGRPQPPTTP